MIARSLWHTGPGKIEIRDSVLPEPTSDQVVIRSIHSFVSQGTEALVNAGMVPETLYREMSVPYMQGRFDLPCTYGYSLIGEIIEGPEHLIGKSGHIMHPHQDICLVKGEDLYILDAGETRKAALISNMETAINAIWDAELNGDEKVLVLGLGSVGMLTALTLQNRSHLNLAVNDLSISRVKEAQQLGLNALTNELDFDVVFHTTSSNEGLQTAIDLAGHEGKVIELSWYGTKRVSLDLGSSFHYKRKKIIGSQVSHIPNSMSREWDYKKRKELAWHEIKRLPELNFHEVEFKSLKDRFDPMINDHSFNLIKY